MYYQYLTFKVCNPGKTIFEASKLLPLDASSTCGWTSFNCHLVWVINLSLLLYVLVCFPDGLKTSSAARLMLSRCKETVGKHVSHLGYIFHNCQGFGHPLPWANDSSLPRNVQTCWSYRCPYHPQLSGKVKGTNDILELKVSKLAETAGLPCLRYYLALLTAVSPFGSKNLIHMR